MSEILYVLCNGLLVVVVGGGLIVILVTLALNRKDIF